MTSLADRFRFPPIKPSIALAAGVGGIALATIAIARSLPGPVAALTAPLARRDGDDPLGRYLREHEELAERSRLRFEGRSMFFAPPAPRQPPPPARPAVDQPPPPPPPPPAILPAPAVYDGPKPRGLIGSVVFFDDTRIRVGETLGEVEVLDARGPFAIKLAWTKVGHERGEYIVSTWGERTRNFEGGAPNPFPKTTTGFQTGPAGAAGAGGSGSSPLGGASAAASGQRAPLQPGAAGAPGGGPAGASGQAQPASANSAVAGGGAGAAPAAAPVAEGRRARPSPPTPNDEPPAEPAPEPEPEPTSEPDSPAEDGADLIPLNELPAPLTQEAIAAMSKPAAQQAMTAIAKILAKPNVDSHSRARLEHEVELLAARLRSDA